MARYILSHFYFLSYFSSMSLLGSKSSIFAMFKSLGLLFLFILFGLFLDSSSMVAITNNAQTYANMSMVIGFSVTFYSISRRVREQMILAVVIAVFGEYLFSIVLGGRKSSRISTRKQRIGS